MSFAGTINKSFYGLCVLLWTGDDISVHFINHKEYSVCCTLRYLEDFPIQINTIKMGLSIVYFKGSHIEIFK